MGFNSYIFRGTDRHRQDIDLCDLSRPLRDESTTGKSIFLRYRLHSERHPSLGGILEFIGVVYRSHLLFPAPTEAVRLDSGFAVALERFVPKNISNLELKVAPVEMILKDPNP